MRLHRFFLQHGHNKLSEQKEIVISDENFIHQWKNVFRMRVGDRVILFDGSKVDFECEILEFDKKEVRLSVIKKIENNNKSTKEIWLYQSMIKKDKMEWIFEKCTELGVSHFAPIISERSEKKSLNEERAKKIIIEAVEQSGGQNVPVLHEPISLKEALENLPSPAVAFDPSGLLINATSSKSQVLSLFIGPEGGWTEKELEMFKEKKVPIYNLGNKTLRAETASVVASALFLI